MSTSPATAIEPRFRQIDGVRVRYADSGGEHGETLLLTSPTVTVGAAVPIELGQRLRSWVLAGHFVWEEAATEYAAAIVDSIGG